MAGGVLTICWGLLLLTTTCAQTKCSGQLANTSLAYHFTANCSLALNVGDMCELSKPFGTTYAGGSAVCNETGGYTVERATACRSENRDGDVVNKCHFPFTVNNTLYHTCQPTNNRYGLWCSEVANWTMDEPWGICACGLPCDGNFVNNETANHFIANCSDPVEHASYCELTMSAGYGGGRVQCNISQPGPGVYKVTPAFSIPCNGTFTSLPSDYNFFDVNCSGKTAHLEKCVVHSKGGFGWGSVVCDTTSGRYIVRPSFATACPGVVVVPQIFGFSANCSGAVAHNSSCSLKVFVGYQGGAAICNTRTGRYDVTPATSLSLSDSLLRSSRTDELQSSQAGNLTLVTTLAATLLGFFLLVVLVSKYAFRDETANYVPVLQCCFVVFEVFSDANLLLTLKNAGELYQLYFLIGAVSLGAVAVINAVAAVLVVRVEMQRKPDFARFVSEHRVAVGTCLLLSPLRSNLLVILGSGLFAKSSKTFQAPLPKNLRTKFRLTSLVSLVGEDGVQAFLVVWLQSRLLGGWTTLNLVAVSTSLLSLLVGLAINVNALCRAHYFKKARAYYQVPDSKASGVELSDSEHKRNKSRMSDVFS